ncbi:MAG TPA: hypothetical protein VF832_02155 [Longimicrobiales bacterium]
MSARLELHGSRMARLARTLLAVLSTGFSLGVPLAPLLSVR